MKKQRLSFCSLLALIVVLNSFVFAQPSGVLTLPTNCVSADDELKKNGQNNNDYDASITLSEKYKEFFIDMLQIVPLNLIISTMGCITHELGHYVAAKCLFNLAEPIQVHIGKLDNEESIAKIFSLGFMHFYKGTWNVGYTDITAKGNSSRVDNMLVNAGGILTTPFLFLGLIWMIIWYYAYYNNEKFSDVLNNKEGISLFETIASSKLLSIKQKRFLLNSTLIIYINYFEELFYVLTPLRSGGDGTNIWKNDLGVSNKLLKIIHILSDLGLWACWTMILKQYCEARRKLSPQISQVSLFAGIAAILLLRMRFSVSDD